ncbi:hypothetical protein GN958_ATG20627, partial [Phytophthora infestans]
VLEPRIQELPSCCGVKRNDNAFVFWWHNLKVDAILVTIVLLDAALQEVRKFKLKKVVIWDPPYVRRLFEIEVAERKLSLSSAMVFRRWNTQESTSKALPHRFCNENYVWV